MKLVGFDFGDTLVSYALSDEQGQIDLLTHFWEDAKGSALAAYPSAVQALEDNLPTFCRRLNTERPDHAVWPFVERIRAREFLGDGVPVHVAKYLEEQLCAAVFETANILSGSVETLRALKDANCVTGIMSNLPWGTNPQLWRAEIERHGFGSDLVDHVILCGDVGFRKPDPAGLLAMEALAMKASRRYFVGDRDSDADAAIAAGWNPILFRQNQTSLESTQAVVPTLEDVVDVVLHDGI